MTHITVVAQAVDSFKVEVRGHGSVTNHTVGIPAGFAASVGCADVAPEELVRFSFEFLLEHEPPTSILRRFRLDQITEYFADYPVEIARRAQEAT